MTAAFQSRRADLVAELEHIRAHLAELRCEERVALARIEQMDEDRQLLAMAEIAEALVPEPPAQPQEDAAHDLDRVAASSREPRRARSARHHDTDTAAAGEAQSRADDPAAADPSRCPDHPLSTMRGDGHNFGYRWCAQPKCGWTLGHTSEPLARDPRALTTDADQSTAFRAALDKAGQIGIREDDAWVSPGVIDDAIAAGWARRHDGRLWIVEQKDAAE